MEKFNSVQYIHELLSILTFVRIYLGFQNILGVNDIWHLVIICNSIVHRMNNGRQDMALRQRFIKIT